MPQMWGIYPAIFDSVTVNNLLSADLQSGVQLLSVQPAGSVDKKLIATGRAEPVASLETYDVATLLANAPLMTGLAVSSSYKLQCQARSDGGTFAGSGSHLTITGTKGFLMIEEISASQDAEAPAMAKAKFYPLYDGSNAPTNVNTGQDLSGSVAISATHALGPVLFEGQTGGLGGVTSVTVTPKLEYTMPRSDGDLVAQVGAITARDPEIKITSLNLSKISALSLDKSVAISSGLTIYLQKINPGGTRVAYGTSQHISISVTAGTYVLTQTSGRSNQNGTFDLLVKPINNAITVSTSAAISIP